MNENSICVKNSYWEQQSGEYGMGCTDEVSKLSIMYISTVLCELSEHS